MSEVIKAAIIGGGATIIAALISVIFKKKTVSNDHSVKQKQKGNNNIQIGHQIQITNEENSDDWNYQ